MITPFTTYIRNAFTAPDPQHIEQMRVEHEAAHIMREIRSCRSITRWYELVEAVMRLRQHGNSIQVTCWIDSLNLDLKNKWSEMFQAM